MQEVTLLLAGFLSEGEYMLCYSILLFKVGDKVAPCWTLV